MADFGYSLSCEEHDPTELMEQARKAADFVFLSPLRFVSPWPLLLP